MQCDFYYKSYNTYILPNNTLWIKWNMVKKKKLINLKKCLNDARYDVLPVIATFLTVREGTTGPWVSDYFL